MIADGFGQLLVVFLGLIFDFDSDDMLSIEKLSSSKEDVAAESAIVRFGRVNAVA